MDERRSFIPIGCLGSPRAPVFKTERMVSMQFGKDFFKIFNFAILLIRMFMKVFGDEEDKKAVEESERRTGNGNGDTC